MLRTVTTDHELIQRYLDKYPRSAGKVGDAIGTSGTRVREYGKGVDGRGGKVRIPPGRLADLAHVMGYTVADLRSAGRDDAADLLADGRMLSAQPSIERRIAEIKADVDRLLSDVRKGLFK